ncbi:MAG: hypothetical protein JWO59_915, partial [Chloroflexi bacterium]|nr:hypothetical protein [Chloroflexota bacterium]
PRCVPGAWSRHMPIELRACDAEHDNGPAALHLSTPCVQYVFHFGERHMALVLAT